MCKTVEEKVEFWIKDVKRLAYISKFFEVKNENFSGCLHKGLEKLLLTNKQNLET